MFSSTPLQDLLIYRPKVFEDQRGYFFESYNQNHFLDQGINVNFIQDNRSYSKKGTLRGLHFQEEPYAQAKLVGVLRGEVYDVAVDLRPYSPTFKKWFGITLSENTKEFVYIPKGFAHGFLVLSNAAEFFYKVDNPYNPNSEAGISFSDPELDIKWPVPSKDLLLSNKDQKLPLLAQYLLHKGV